MADKRRISSFRLSSGTFNSDFSASESTRNDIEDPIEAYFKQRCRDSSFFKAQRESDRESSLGLIDVDNVSLFGDGDEDENFNSPQKSLEKFQKVSIGKSENNKNMSSTSKSESHLEKQRALAQEVLKKLSSDGNDSQIHFPLTPEKSRHSNALSDISSKLINGKTSIGKKMEKNWFQPNFSPDTPRYFNDELSSFGGEDGLLLRNESKFEGNDRTRQSQYARKVNLMLKELSQINLSTDVEFESQNQEDQINRLEEDEKKFKLENSGLMHNSGISQFSGVNGEDVSYWINDAAKEPKSETDPNKLSIGQFFNMRSNRVSSLIGSASDEKLPSTEFPKLTESEMKVLMKNEYSLPIGETSNTEKAKLRRWVSNNDLKRVSDIAKTSRFSNDSSASNSTVMIQNIIAEMESGLSGTQIYEKLMKSYMKDKMSEKENKKNFERVAENKKNLERIAENSETPKSSKVLQRKDFTKMISQEADENNSNKLVKNLGGGRKSPKLTPRSNSDCKENERLVDFLTPTGRNDKIKKIRSRSCFEASTPKIQGPKSHNDTFKTACNKLLMNSEDWEEPRVSSIQPRIELNKSVLSDENEKTIMVSSGSSSELSKKNSTININDTLTVEDTIVAGDLTVLSQRIEEMKEDGVCIVRTTENEEPVLLSVVQKIASLPKGTVDCSALTPLLRDQFPELLSTFPTSKESVSNSFVRPNRENDSLVSEEGSWVKLPKFLGYSENIYVCAEAEQAISIPLTNVSKKWLLVSIESITLDHPARKLHGTKKNEDWVVRDFVIVYMRETLVPPDSHQSLEILYTPNVPTSIDLKITFTLKDLMTREVETRSTHIRTHSINPSKNINVTPTDPINFGTIASQCSDSRTVQVSFDGICKLPLLVYIEGDESQSQHFTIKPTTHQGVWGKNKCLHEFHEGEKQVFEFQVVFQPNILTVSENATEEFKITIVLKIGSKTDSDGILQKIPVKGSVGFVKFLCNSSCNPLVFRSSERGHCVTRSFPLKNAGTLPIAFTVSVTRVNTEKEDEDNIFTVPKSFYLSRNEESEINITYNANSFENCTKRLLNLKINPNGRKVYSFELIGIITSSERRPPSQSSRDSISTKSLPNSESKPIKLLTTTNSLGWPAVPLEKEVRMTFQLKNASSVQVTARIYFKENLDSFKLVHENGEKVQKLRKVLKPDCPCTITVAFRPDLIGAHVNVVYIEINQNTKKMVWLNGVGGIPNLFLGNVKSDLNGCKILRLQNPKNQFYANLLEFNNKGRVPGFISIKTNMEVPSLSSELVVSPSNCVIPPNSQVSVNVVQRLKSEDLKLLLSGRDISKLATLSIIIGDEPSRLRMRKLIKSGVVEGNGRLKDLTATFHNEKELNSKLFQDSAMFESSFLKNLKLIEVAVVVEKSNAFEPTIMEDADETADAFVTIISAVDSVKPSRFRNPHKNDVHHQEKALSDDYSTSVLSTESDPPQYRIARWIEGLEYSKSTS